MDVNTFKLGCDLKAYRLIRIINLNCKFSLQEGVSDPPSISSISRLLRGGSRDDGKKDYSIDGILGGKLFLIFSLIQYFCT